MAGNEGTIGSKLQLDGEQQYKQALNEAYSALKVLRSELKAETAELGRNASSQDKARAKINSLKQQITQQEKVVATLTQALSDSKEQYADNQEVQDKWADKLNKARAALAEMKNQLGDAEDALGQFGEEMKDVSGDTDDAVQTVFSLNDAFKSIGDIVSGIGSSISGIFDSTVDTMKEMVDEMFSLMGQAWAAAEDWKDIQSMWGGSTESIEKVFTGMKFRGIDSGEITSGIQKLVSNTHSKNKDTMKALKQLHISEKDYASHWEYFIDVMEALSDRKDDQEALAFKIFGDKKGAGMMKVLSNWRDAMGTYEEDVEKPGLAIKSDEIDKLDEVAKKIREVQETWNVIKLNIGAKLSDILNMDQLSDDALEILRSIGKLFSGEGDKKEIVMTLDDQINTLITDIQKALGNLSDTMHDLGGSLKNSDNPIVQFVGRLIDSLGGILDWLSEHGTEVTDFLEKVMPWVLRNKVAEAVTGKGIGDWVTDALQTGLQVAMLAKMGAVIGTGAGTAMGASAATIGAGIGSTLLSAIEGGIGAVMIYPLVDALLHPEKYDKFSEERKTLEQGPTTAADVLTMPDGGKKALHALFTNEVEPETENSEFGKAPFSIPTKRTPQGNISGWEITPEQAQAAEDFWDAIRKSDLPGLEADNQRENLLAAFHGAEDIAANLEELMFWLGNQENGWEREDLPEGWYQKSSGKVEEMITAMNAVASLLKEKYTGGQKDEEQPITIKVTANTYVDGEMVAQKTDEYQYGSLTRAAVNG